MLIKLFGSFYLNFWRQICRPQLFCITDDDDDDIVNTNSSLFIQHLWVAVNDDMKRFIEQLWSEAISFKINIILVVLCILYVTHHR
jgi:hypothetical protein